MIYAALTVAIIALIATGILTAVLMYRVSKLDTRHRETLVQDGSISPHPPLRGTFPPRGRLEDGAELEGVSSGTGDFGRPMAAPTDSGDFGRAMRAPTGDDEKKILRCAQNDRVQNDGASFEADLDLFGRMRPTMTVRMPETGELLHIKMPTKQIADSFDTIGVLMERYAVGKLSETDIDRLFNLSAVVLRHNLEKQYISADELRQTFSPEYCVDVLTAYMDFITKQLEQNQIN